MTIVLSVLLVGANADVTNLKGDRMTLNAASSKRLASYTTTSSGLTLTAGGYNAPLSLTRMPLRNYEVAALRPDGSLTITQDKAPAMPVFENAFSAFAQGTPILTPDGYVSVEDLHPGDEISTTEGDVARLIWVGSSQFVPADAGRRTPLIRVMPDSFGVGRPNSFVTFGPGARILKTPHHMRGDVGDGKVLTPVREFVDGVNVIEVVPPTPVRLFHICLERHAVIKAGGIEMETYHPGSGATQEMSETLRNRFLGMFPGFARTADFGQLALPRAPEPEVAVRNTG